MAMLLAPGPGGRNAGLEITWSSVEGGGVVTSAGGDLVLSGTIGQPDAGAMAGGDLTLTGGFWFGLVVGDFNSDGGVNLLDYEGFESCLRGPTGGLGDGCDTFDVDGTGQVDLADFAALQTSFTGGA